MNIIFLFVCLFEVEFAEGDWYGVELDEGFEGRNDGSYEGKQYFECKAGQGVFLQGRNFRGLVVRKIEK